MILIIEKNKTEKNKQEKNKQEKNEEIELNKPEKTEEIKNETINKQNQDTDIENTPNVANEPTKLNSKKLCLQLNTVSVDNLLT